MKDRIISFVKRIRRPNRGDIVTLALFLMGVIFICNGITMGEVQVLWHKAILVCLECIGIG